jgi:hypothetical protein
MSTTDPYAASLSRSLEILDSMPPVSLAEMDRVRLLDRSETKYVFPAVLLPDILGKTRGSYAVLEVDGKRHCAYETLYFDTVNQALYLMHHNGRGNRYKFRIRTYLETGVSYFEFKQKTPKKRTVKKRIRCGSETATTQSPALFERLVPEHSALVQRLAPSLKVNYSRVTLVNPVHAERITIDTGLEFLAGTSGRGMPHVCIAEVKQEKDNASPFVRVMHELHLQPLRFSKYCQGMIEFHPDIKKNNFKPRLMRLEKIMRLQSKSLTQK